MIQLIKRICPTCGVEFEFKLTKKTENRKYCSQKCMWSGNGKSNKGRKFSVEVNKSKGRKGEKNGFYGKHHTEETKQKIKADRVGLSYEERYGEDTAKLIKEKISESTTGEKNGFYGKHHTNESKSKISENHRSCVGELNPMFGNGWKIKGEKNGSWKGGTSDKGYGEEFTNELCTSIRKRDKFTCAVCNKQGFVVHHIDYVKSNNDIDNLITLCRSCHGKTNFNRESWMQFFNEYKKQNL